MVDEIKPVGCAFFVNKVIEVLKGSGKLDNTIQAVVEIADGKKAIYSVHPDIQEKIKEEDFVSTEFGIILIPGPTGSPVSIQRPVISKILDKSLGSELFNQAKEEQEKLKEAQEKAKEIKERGTNYIG